MNEKSQTYTIEGGRVPQETNEQSSNFKEKRKVAYSEAIETFRRHDSAELEAEQLLFRERLAKSGPEVAIAGLELKIAAAQQQKDNFEKNKDAFSAEAWAVRVQFLTAMRDMFALYCDAWEKSPDLAKYMEEDMPWLSKTLEKAEELVQDSESDDYSVDEDHKMAA